jgi:formyl-CoA transferase/CoA:oxalate CoA-transferase
MSLTGPEEGEPHRAGVAIADLSAGMFAATAIVGALFRRERGGGGQRIDISLMDAQISLLSYVASNFLVTGQVPRRFGNAHPNIVPYQAFRGRDGYFAFAAGNDLQWRRFCEAVQQPEWSSDPRFASNAERLTHRKELVGVLQALFSQRSVAEWLEVCRRSGVAAGPIRTLDQVFADPYVREREMLVEVEHPTAGLLSMVGSPFKISGESVRMRMPPPLLGQHSGEILSEGLGYSAAQISNLRERGVV